MTQFFSQHISVPDDVLIRELGGESIILYLATEHYYGLDDIGTRMWQALSSSDTIQEAYDTLLLEYDVEPQRLQRDLQELVTQLVASSLLQIEADQA